MLFRRSQGLVVRLNLGWGKKWIDPVRGMLTRTQREWEFDSSPDPLHETPNYRLTWRRRLNRTGKIQMEGHRKVVHGSMVGSFGRITNLLRGSPVVTVTPSANAIYMVVKEGRIIDNDSDNGFECSGKVK